MSEIYKWRLTEAGNGIDPAPDGWPELMARSDVNNGGRELQRALRQWYDDPEWLSLMRDADGDSLVISKSSDTIVVVEGADMTSYFPANRRIRMSDGGALTTYGHVVSAAFTGGNTEVTVENMSGAGSVVPAGCDTLDLHHSSTLAKLAYQDAIDLGFYIPETPDNAGLQAAIDAANAAGGGIVLLTESNYTVSSFVTVKSGVSVFGAGTESTTITAAAGLVNMVFNMNDDSSLIGMTIDCSAQTGGSEAVRCQANVNEVVLSQLYIKEAFTTGILLSGVTIVRVFMSDIWIDDPGKSGISVESDVADEIAIANVSVRNPGADGATIDVYGVRLQGKCVANNIHVTCNRASPQKQRGVYFASRDGSGLSYARQCSVTGLRVEGTGTQAIGAEIGGSGNMLSNATMNLSGSSSRGVLIDNIGAGQVSDHHTVSNVTVTAADIGLQIAGDGDENVITGCVITGANTTSIQVGGERNRVSGCFTKDGGSPSIEVLPAASGTDINGCTIDRAGTGVGLDLDASDCRVCNNTFTDCADAINEDAASKSCRVFGNTFDGCTDLVAVYNDGKNLWDGNFSPNGVRIPLRDNGVYVSLENDVTGSLGVVESIFVPTLYSQILHGDDPNGARWWFIEMEGTIDFDSSVTLDRLLNANTSFSLTGVTRIVDFQNTTGDPQSWDLTGPTDSVHGNAVLANGGVYWRAPSGLTHVFMSGILSGPRVNTHKANSGGAPIYSVSNAFTRITYIGDADMESVTS